MGINHTSNTKTVIILYACDLLLTIIGPCHMDKSFQLLLNKLFTFLELTMESLFFTYNVEVRF